MLPVLPSLTLQTSPLECFFFLNSPWIFRPLWAIVRPWLDPVTKRKFHVLGEFLLRLPVLSDG
jgi:hypothetical protein